MKNVKIISIIVIIILLNSREISPATCCNDEQIMIDLHNYAERKRYEEELERFIDRLGFDESRNNWLVVNSIGAIGEFQFMEYTLRHLGYDHITVKSFQDDPSIFSPMFQRIALKNLIDYNTYLMRNYTRYEGTFVGGILITRAGIIAACHLGGPGSVRLFLSTDGRVNKRDAYGTSIRDYMYRYQNYKLNTNYK